MMGYYGNGMMSGMLGWGILALIFVLAVVVAIAFLIAFLVKRTAGPRENPSIGPTPDDILRQRFAAGEIDDEEFKRRRAALK